MLHRCRHPTASNYKRYGGRGISVCRRWEKFENFLADMGPRFQPGLTLERVKNHKGYSKTNCRWATYGEQMRNQRSTVMLNTPWGRLCMKDAAAKAGIYWLTLRYRIKSGWHSSRWFDPVGQGGDRRSKDALSRQKARRS